MAKASAVAVPSPTATWHIANLVPYADLTEETVIGWVKDALGPDKVLEIGQALLAQLEEQRHPSKAAGVPWTVATVN